MSDLICENYPMVLVMSRFGIDLGFGEKNIGEVCRQNKIDTYTFLTVVNFLTETETIPAAEVHKDISISSLITYLHNAHDYFLNFRRTGNTAETLTWIPYPDIRNNSSRLSDRGLTHL